MASSANSPPEAPGGGDARAGGAPGSSPARPDRTPGGLTAWLYRHRGTTAVPFAVAAVWGAQPRPAAAIAGAVLVVLGEALRLWAAAWIGPHCRGASFQAPRLVTGGPYRWMRHPLYVGNGILCAGLLLFSGAYAPWLPLILGAAFLVQYGLFIRREELLLAGMWGDAWEEYRRRVPPLGVGRHGPLPSAAPAPPAGPAPLDRAFRLEWPTLRTVLGLLALIAIRWFLRRP